MLMLRRSRYNSSLFTQGLDGVLLHKDLVSANEKSKGAFDSAETKQDESSFTDLGMRLQIFPFVVSNLLRLKLQCPAVLDIGSSEGRVIPFILSAHCYPDFYAVDIRHKALAKLKSRYPKVNTLNMSAADIGNVFSAGCFDYIIMTEFLEHVPFELGQSVISQAYKLLRPGGLLAITTPNFDADLDPVWELERFGHVQLYTKTSLVGLLGKAGFALDVVQDGRYLSSKIRINHVRKHFSSQGPLGNKLLTYFETAYGTTLTSYLLGGLLGEEAGVIRILARKP